MYRHAVVRRVAQLYSPFGCQAPRPYGMLKGGQAPLVMNYRNQILAALRARDAPRLTVLRAILAAEHNASKTDTPINTNAKLIAQARKLQKLSQDAMAEAEAAARPDLVEKLRHEIEVFEDIIAGSGVQVLKGAELKAVVQEAVDASKKAGTEGKSLLGDVMKRLSYTLDGKDVDRRAAAAFVKELTDQKGQGA